MKAYASHACIVFQMWMSIFAIATKQSEEQKKKKNYCPRVHWDKCTSMNMIDFSQEDDDEIQIGIEHTKTM